MRRKSISFGFVYVFGYITLSSVSCVSSKSITYFNNLTDSAKIQLEEIQPPQLLIQVNDILEIKIGGESEKTVQYINQYFSGGVSGGLQVVVDIEGNIELPKIGKLKVAGLSKDAAKDIISNAYKEYLIDPIVAVKFGNFRFSVIGEVGAPGTYNVPVEKFSIFEALAQAGDLTPYAKWNKIRIIRDINSTREIISIDLTDKKILNSPNYYINRYDVIYVEPKHVKFTTENFQRTATYITTAFSILTIFLVLFKK